LREVIPAVDIWIQVASLPLSVNLKNIPFAACWSCFMTRKVILELDLNENDFEALTRLIENPESVARTIAPDDARVRSRLIDLLVQIGDAVERPPAAVAQ
jgi:hypothetical protein